MKGLRLARGDTASRGFDPQRLRAGLRTFEFTDPPRIDSEAAAYFAYYGIDFENRMTEMNHHFGALAVAGFSLACHFYEVRNARGTCVLLHGYFDHCGLYGHLIEYCLRHGYSVLIWDLPGHGLSNGRQASIHDFAIYTNVLGGVLDHFREYMRMPLVAIGQSTGAAILMSWSLRAGLAVADNPFERIVLLAPLVRPSHWGSVRILHTLLKPFRGAVRRKFTSNTSDRRFLDFVRVDPLQSRVLPVPWVSALRRWVREFNGYPTSDLAPVVVQGTLDETVDWRWNLQMIREKFPHAEVHVLEGARHQLVNEVAATREMAFAAIGLS